MMLNGEFEVTVVAVEPKESRIVLTWEDDGATCALTLRNVDPLAMQRARGKAGRKATVRFSVEVHGKKRR